MMQLCVFESFLCPVLCQFYVHHVSFSLSILSSHLPSLIFSHSSFTLFMICGCTMQRDHMYYVSVSKQYVLV